MAGTDGGREVRGRNENFEQKLNRIRQQRQAHLGLAATDEPPGAMEAKPRFLQSAEARARERGVSAREVLDDDLKRLREARYPGSDCLQPFEVEEYLAHELPEARLSHLETCAGCRLLVEAMKSRPAPFWLVHDPDDRALEAAHQRPHDLALGPTGPYLAAATARPFAIVRGALVPVTAALLLVLFAIPFTRRGLPSPPVLQVAVLPTETSSGMTVASLVDSMLLVDGKARVIGPERIARLACDSAPAALGDGWVVVSSCENDEHAERSQTGCSRVVVSLEKAGAAPRTFSEDAVSAHALFAVSVKAGSWVRRQLGLGELSVDQLKQARALLPLEDGAAQHYSMAQLDIAEHRPVEARRALEAAISREPHPLVYAALSKVNLDLGDFKAGRQAAEEVLRAAKGYSLPDATRLKLRAEVFEAHAEWLNAAKTYSELESASPEGNEYGIRIARDYLKHASPWEALTKVEELRSTGVSEVDSALLDLVEAKAAELIGDHRRQQLAAGRATRRGQMLKVRGIEAEGRLLAGTAARALGNLEAADRELKIAAELFHRIGDQSDLADTLREQGVVRAIRDDLGAAQSRFEAAREWYQASGNGGGEATIETDLGNVLAQHGNLQEAMGSYQQAQRRFNDLGNRQGVARALICEGSLLQASGDLAGAKARFDEALSICQQLSDQSGEADVLSNRGGLLFVQGRFAEATKDLAKALEIRKEKGLKRGEAIVEQNLALALIQQDQLDLAATHYAAALAIYGDLHDEVGVARARCDEAELLIEQNRAKEAEAEVRQVLNVFSSHHLQRDDQLARIILGRSLLSQGQWRKALSEIAPIQRDTLAGPTQAELQILSARLDIAAGHPGSSVSGLEKLLGEVNYEHFMPLALEVRLVLGEAKMSAGDAIAGRNLLAEVEREARSSGAKLIARKASALLGARGSSFSLMSFLRSTLGSWTTIMSASSP